MNSSKVVYTSNFYSTHLIPDGYSGVSIAISSPQFFGGRKEPCFMPTWSLVSDYKNGLIGEKEYIDKYLELLLSRKDEISKVIKRLENDKVVYLCHERKDNFCHRHIVAKLLESYGFTCSEL